MEDTTENNTLELLEEDDSFHALPRKFKPLKKKTLKHWETQEIFDSTADVSSTSNAAPKMFKPLKKLVPQASVSNCSNIFSTTQISKVNETFAVGDGTFFSTFNAAPKTFKIHKKLVPQPIMNCSNAFSQISKIDETFALDVDGTFATFSAGPKKFRPKKLAPQVNASNAFSPSLSEANLSKEVRNITKDSSQDFPVPGHPRTISKRCSRILSSSEKLRCQYKTVHCSFTSNPPCIEDKEPESSSSEEDVNPNFCDTPISPIFPPSLNDKIVEDQERPSSCLSMDKSFDSNLAVTKNVYDLSDFSAVLNDIRNTTKSKSRISDAVDNDIVSEPYNVSELSGSEECTPENIRILKKSLKKSTKVSARANSDSSCDVRRLNVREDDESNFMVRRSSSCNKNVKKKKSIFTDHDLSVRLLTKGKARKKPLPLMETFIEHQPYSHSQTKIKGKENIQIKRPAYWATNKLYEFLRLKLEPRFGEKWKKIAVNFVCSLSDLVTKTINCHSLQERAHLTEILKADFITLELARCDFEFYDFMIMFLPDEYINITVPSLLPYTEKLNVLNFKPKNLYRSYF
ncbi:unnamed protein product [Bemisia tabaci]|uniref:Uncharacterized protein n=1 Tax=Bemisia tabaci TaxID=7038 RepID=A0A9P0F6B8_BEMTA|nr:unnamed protein product [Bemisia tabaci]